MKALFTTLGIIFIVLQYKLWLGEDSVRALNMLEEDLAAQRAVNEELAARNDELEVEVLDLKNGLEAVEERARSELGMIGEDETFFLIVE
ncbi:MAG: septum formation initiator family protein [Gammaproteobacteria bacterium]